MAGNGSKAPKMKTRKTSPGSKPGKASPVRKNTGKPSSAANKKPGKNKSARKFRLPSLSLKGGGGIPMKNEIWLVASFGIMIVMTLSNFGLCGVAGRILSNYCFGIFGCAQYVMPVAFFAGVAILIANDYSLLSVKKCAAGFILLMMVSAFAQVIYTGSGQELMNLVFIASKNHWTGGIIGGGFALLLKNLFGMAGAIVIIVCITVLSLVMLTQKSFVQFFKNIVAGIKRSAVSGRKKASEEQEDQRIRQCEEIVKEMEMEAASAEAEPSREKAESQEAIPDQEDRQEPVREVGQDGGTPEEPDSSGSSDMPVPVVTAETSQEESPDLKPATSDMGVTFTSSENLQMKDSIRELHAGEYPLEGEEETVQPAGARILRDIDFEKEKGEDPREPQEKAGISAPDGFGLPKAEPADPRITSELLPGEKAGREQAELDAGNRTGEAGTRESDYIFPPVTLLHKGTQKLSDEFQQNLKKTAQKLQQTLASFGVRVTITDISCGPTVTRYEMFPEQGTKVSKIVSLTDDIKLNLAAADIRIEAPIPGKSAIGIEVPNTENLIVHFREMVDNRIFRNYKSRLAFAVGKDIAGKPVVADLDKMPHLLIAGATGSGKSVCINTLIMSILYKARPDEVKLIMIDPKMVELSVYNGIPHLLIPVVTDPKKASGALNWAVAEMQKRYSDFSQYGVRNIDGYNKKIDKLTESGEIKPGDLAKMSQIVIIIDELADLMMVAPGEVEDAIVRLSQLARAAGIHLVIATQRPSVNVITGLIKANVPSRIAFSVSSGVDSRTIIDMNGAEKLLGKGDMLFYPSGYQKPVRVQGAFVSDQEVSEVVEFLKENEKVTEQDTQAAKEIEHKIKSRAVSKERDEYFEAAARFFVEKDKATIGMLQRMFKIGFNRAARIVDQLAEEGIVGPEEGTRPRKVLMSPEQLDQYFEEQL